MEARQHTDLEPIHPGSGRSRGWLKRIGGVAVAVGLILAKLGGKAKLILVALPKLKLFSTSASMLVSIVAYQLIFGWAFAVGFVLLLLLHELGHVIQLRREGVEASAPMFIPFLGAVISAKSLGGNAAAARSSARSPPWSRSPSGSRPAATSGGRSPTSASSSTSSTCCRCCRSTAAGRWPRSPRTYGRRGSPA